MLKLIDWIVIIIFGDTFGLNDLQFAYQPGISTDMCTYAILETIDYFLRNGSKIFACTMDMTKAFDLTMHSKLFSLSGEKHINMVLLKCFVSFMERIDKSSKTALKILKQEALKDVRSITGTNYQGTS